MKARDAARKAAQIGIAKRIIRRAMRTGRRADDPAILAEIEAVSGMPRGDVVALVKEMIA